MLEPLQVLKLYPPHDGSLASLLASRASVAPQRPCIVFEEQVLTYAEVQAAAERAAALYAARGVCAGDRVGVMSTNHPSTVLTLLAKPVRRHEVVLGKFLGILMAILAAFAILMFISLCTVWWNEAAVDKRRTNPVRIARKLPWLATGQSIPVVVDSYEDLVTIREARGTDYLRSAGDLLLLATGQSSQLVARVPLAAQRGGAEGSPGLASIVRDLLRFAAVRTRMLLQAFALAFVHVMVIAAVAIAVSTRLPLVFNALFCAAFFVLGNVWYDLSREWFGTDVHLLPNFQNLNLTEALSVGIGGDPWGGWAPN